MATKARTKKAAAGDPDAINDPERELGSDEVERRSELEDRQEITISSYNPVAHQEILINFTGLPPETDFEVKIAGDTPQNYWVTLKSDPWGQAQLIWRTPVGGKYKITGKGGTGAHKVNVSESFEVLALDADEDYRRSKKKDRRRAPGGNVQTVEEPGTMGDTPSGEEKYQYSEEEAENPQINDPAFTPAEHDPEDQGDPNINKEPHPEGSAQFNYREPGEAETVGTESKEDPDADSKAAKKAIKDETKRARKAREKDSGEVSEMAGMSEPKSQEEIDQENAHTGNKEAGR
jgi:hypothetical protein